MLLSVLSKIKINENAMDVYEEKRISDKQKINENDIFFLKWWDLNAYDE